MVDTSLGTVALFERLNRRVTIYNAHARATGKAA